MVSLGTMRYSIWEGGRRLVVEVDPELVKYYRSLVPGHLPVQPSRWKPHITVVRAHKEVPSNLGAWEKYEREEVEFTYTTHIHMDGTYYWLNVACERLSKVRQELGLPVKSKWTRPPSGDDCFHITIGNRKHMRSP